ncbi:MAG: hypothetical protein AAGF95_21625 [Chloroflexota bacterium]
MFKNFFSKLYQVTDVSEQRWVASRTILIVNLLVMVMWLPSFPEQNSNTGGIEWVIFGNALLLIARLLSRERQPLIGHLSVAGILAMCMGMLLAFGNLILSFS